MKRFTYYMQPRVHEGGKMKPKEAENRLRSMLNDWESFCDIRFTQTTSSASADIKIKFRSHQEMCERTAGPLCGLGLAYVDHGKVGAGTILWDETRSFGSHRWAYESQHAHEIGHLFRMNHDSTIEHNTKVIMHPHGGADWFDGDWVARYQRWAGVKSVKTWVPRDRKFAAQEVRELRAKRLDYRRKRDEAIARGQGNRAKLENARMHNVMSKEIKTAQRWHKINNYWRRLNLVGCHIA